MKEKAATITSGTQFYSIVHYFIGIELYLTVYWIYNI
jgi:hypothetical protein